VTNPSISSPLSARDNMNTATPQSYFRARRESQTLNSSVRPVEDGTAAISSSGEMLQKCLDQTSVAEGPL
jgi:hypothetical protein